MGGGLEGNGDVMLSESLVVQKMPLIRIALNVAKMYTA